MKSDPKYMREKAFVLAYAKIFFDSKSCHDVVKHIEKKESLSNGVARKGMSMAVADAVDLTARYSYADVLNIDKKLQALGAPSLTEMRGSSSKFMSKILKKRKISNDEEFYLIRGLADNGTLTDSDTLEKLFKLLNNYENI